MEKKAYATVWVKRPIFVDLDKFLPEDRNIEALAEYAGDEDWWWMFGAKEGETPTVLTVTRPNPAYSGPDALFPDMTPPETITETVTL